MKTGSFCYALKGGMLLKVCLWPRRLAVFLMVVNFIVAGSLIAKSFDAAMSGYIWTAIVAVVLSGLNVTAGAFFVDNMDSFIG